MKDVKVVRRAEIGNDHQLALMKMRVRERVGSETERREIGRADIPLQKLHSVAGRICFQCLVQARRSRVQVSKNVEIFHRGCNECCSRVIWSEEV